MPRLRPLTLLSAVLAGAALVWACSGSWYENSALEVGDTAFRRPLESVWAEDFATIVGKAPKPLPIAQPDRVLESVVGLLDQELAARGEPRRAELVRLTALHLSALTAEQAGLIFKDKQGAWRFRSDLPADVDPQQVTHGVPLSATDILRPARLVKAQDLPKLLRELPDEFRFYVRSLTLERADAVALCEALLHLPPAKRRHLSALAAYRLARLRMLMDADVDDDGAVAHLKDVRRDLGRVQQLVAEGAPAIAHLELAADGWLAHTYLYGKSTDSAYDPDDREADPAKALLVYVRLWRAGDATAKVSIEEALRAVLESGRLEPLTRDPVLRRLTTAFLCSGRWLGSELGSDRAVQLNAYATLWLKALQAARVDCAEDAVRLAALQYRLGAWEACARTLRSAPSEDGTARFLEARLRLRAGDLAGAEQILCPLAIQPEKVRPPGPAGENEYHGPPFFSFHAIDFDGPASFIDPTDPPGPALDHGFLSQEHDAYAWDFTQQVGAISRARVELALIELHHGRYVAAMDLFYREGMQQDGDYIAECVLTTAELKAAVDASWSSPADLGKGGSVHDYGLSAGAHVRALLARRLFRDGRMAEAIPYLGEEYRKTLREYLDQLHVAEDANQPAKKRAEAYWKAALNVRTYGEEYLFCSYGLEWTSADDRHWHDRGGLPRSRVHPILDEPENLLAPPGADEIRRVDAWIDRNLEHPNRAHRDARYEFYRLALEAAAQLPDDDLAGAQILQCAGNALKYREPSAAQAAYRELANRFRGTPLGAAARRARWFSAYAVAADPEWVSKLSKLR